MFDEFCKEYFFIIQKNFEELMCLVNDVFDLLWFEVGMMKFNIQEYGLVEFCNEVIYMVCMYSEGCIVIWLENEIDIDLNIWVDIVCFIQVLLSVLIYLQKYKEKWEIDFKVIFDMEKNFINFCIINFLLVDERFIL